MRKKPVAGHARSTPAGLQQFALAALLFGAAIAAYLPAIHGGLLWDDDRHVTAPGMQSLPGLWRIWFEFGATQQYYPFLHSAFWLEHRLWADATPGYHLTNILLHALAAYLLVRILRYLRLPGAWLAGFLFALHPVCVEAVAWISEQKSTLSAVFYLGSALCYLHFDQTRRRGQYVLALALFVLALLSKTVTATLPAMLLVVFWWLRGRLDWKRDVAPLLPWLALGALGGGVTAYVEKHFVGAVGPEFALTFAQRTLLAGRAVWFYLGKLVWPAPLTFIYRRWTLDPAAWWQWLFPLGVVGLLGALLWLAVRQKRRGPLACFLFFLGTLAPALGFVNVYPFLYSYVADHFQYLASIGVIVPAAAGLTLAASRISPGSRLGALPAVAILTVLGIMTFQQSGIYRDTQTLFEATLAKNPDCWLAHNNLGAELLEEPGRLNEAISHLQRSLQLQPNYPQTYNSLGLALSKISGRLPEAIDYFETAVRIEPDYAQAQNNLGAALSNVPDRLPEAITHLEAAIKAKPDYVQAYNNLGNALSNAPGRLADAIVEYQTALRLQPDSPEAHYNLANALSATPGRQDEAISEYQETVRLQPENPRAHNNLGVALSAMPGRLPDAVSEFQAALRMEGDFLDAHYNLGLALSRIPGRAPDAMSEFEAALRINPAWEPARRMLDRLKAAQKNASGPSTGLTSRN